MNLIKDINKEIESLKNKLEWLNPYVKSFGNIEPSSGTATYLDVFGIYLKNLKDDLYLELKNKLKLKRLLENERND